MRYGTHLGASVALLYAVAALTGCQNPSWTVSENLTRVEGESSGRDINVIVSAEPVTIGWGEIHRFELAVGNQSDLTTRPYPYEIDWERTLYMRDGQTQGGFYFMSDFYDAPLVLLHDPHWQGLTHPAPKPRDVVLPGGTFTKEICPTTLAAYGHYTREDELLVLANPLWWAQAMVGTFTGEEPTVGMLWHPSKMETGRNGIFLTLACRNCGNLPPIHFVTTLRLEESED